MAKVVRPAAEEMGEVGRDYIKGWRAKNGSQTLAGADRLLAEAGRESQAVPLKTLLPLLDAASLEDESDMAGRWAALLANAADPAQRVQVQLGFVEVLRQLTPDDAQVLTFIYKWGDDKVSFDRYSQRTFSNILGHFGWARDRMELSLDNLLRQRLIGKLVGGFSSFSDPDPDGLVAPTRLGLAFFAAVTPPTP
ncbi:MAG: Abi-alpha family protein [Janthinobacterium lividum]